MADQTPMRAKEQQKNEAIHPPDRHHAGLPLRAKNTTPNIDTTTVTLLTFR
jgi:hypothetical protein